MKDISATIDILLWNGLENALYDELKKRIPDVPSMWPTCWTPVYNQVALNVQAVIADDIREEFNQKET